MTCIQNDTKRKHAYCLYYQMEIQMKGCSHHLSGAEIYNLLKLKLIGYYKNVAGYSGTILA